MSEDCCCSCPCLGALFERLFKWSKTKVEKHTGKLHTQNVPNPTRSSMSEPAGDIYTALWPFQARANEELTFQEGEHFRICERQDADDQIISYHCSSTICMMHPFSVCVILSVVISDWEVKHIKVHQNQNGSFYLEQSQMFQSLEKLLQHYKRNILSCGICLTRPCARVKSLNHREFLMETQILKNSTPYYIITELMEKGNLLSFLRGEDGQNLEPQELIEMSSQVADGMAYLEEQNSIHRDLAARNVLVGHNYICKVANFGLARIVKWCAPEAISHGRFSNKSDVWSFGVLLYEMFTYGGFPYPGMYTTCVYNIITSGYRMPSPPKCPSHIYDTMLICWRDSSDERPDFNELKMLLENSGTGYMDAVGSRVEAN
uniref:non-specific protein-tyrosine kinase n=1 Tax=Sinocyclocheilus rhinocerous TaxID=307959 RepID=A0A673MT08_9TELE